MKTLLHRRMIGPVLVGLAFLVGMAVTQPGAATQAGTTHRDEYNNYVFEVTAAGSGLTVRALPSQTSGSLDKLFWGDRVLWTGITATAEGRSWMKVAISSGITGWISEQQGWLIDMDPVYTTPGMGYGAVIQVTLAGDDSHCRAVPSSSSTEYRTMQMGDQAAVIGGPYQAEYWMWWQYDLGGFACWIVDVPGWFQVISPGEF